MDALTVLALLYGLAWSMRGYERRELYRRMIEAKRK